MDNKKYKVLAIVVIISLIVGIYFLRPYFSVIAVAAIVAYLTNPAYKWYLKKFKKDHIALWLAFITSLLVVIVPIAIISVITINQTIDMINNLVTGESNLNHYVASLNSALDQLPLKEKISVSDGQVTNWLKENIGTISKSAANIIFSVAGGISTFFVTAIIFIYVYLSLLRKQDIIFSTLNKLDPFGNHNTKMYLNKMGAMTGAMVKGQFVIALIQGIVDAALLWIVGVDYFIFWFVVLSFLSIIPLGGGIIVIPVGIIMILTGNVWQGIVLILGHLLIVTNVDNVLRPKFVPKEASLDPALTMLGVFAGLAMFGFLGIIVGPIIMVLIVTTIEVYLQALEKSREQKSKTN